MKACIIFDTNNGNTYNMAKIFEECLLNKKFDVKIYRVKSDQSFMQENVKKQISKINVIENLDEILECEYLFLGSPTYFGNVSGNTKLFMDLFADLWCDNKMYGKKLIAFTSAGTKDGGGHLCLNAINTFGMHLGFVNIPIPSNLNLEYDNPAYGFIHYSGPNSQNVINMGLKKSIEMFIKNNI